MRFALLDVLTVGRAPRPADREVLPARAAAPPDDGRLQSEALAIMAAEFRRLREQEQSLHRRQAESLESVAEALNRFADGRQAPLAAAPAHDPPADALRADLATRDDELETLRADLATRDDELQTLRADLATREDELQSWRQVRERDEVELAAVKDELTEARARADRATRRLESTQVKLRRARDELAVEKAPVWRRRRARAALG